MIGICRVDTTWTGPAEWTEPAGRTGPAGQVSPGYPPNLTCAVSTTCRSAARADVSRPIRLATSATTRGVANEVPLHCAQPEGNSGWLMYVLRTSWPGAASVIHGPALLHSQTSHPSCAATAATRSLQECPVAAKAAGQNGSTRFPLLPAAATATRSALVNARSNAACRGSGGWPSSVNPPSDRLITCTDGSSRSSALINWSSVQIPKVSSTLRTLSSTRRVCSTITPAMKLAWPTSPSSLPSASTSVWVSTSTAPGLKYTSGSWLSSHSPVSMIATDTSRTSLRRGRSTEASAGIGGPNGPPWLNGVLKKTWLGNATWAPLASS